MLLAACAPRLNEDVRTRIDGAHLVIENRNGGDVHVQLTASPLMQPELPLGRWTPRTEAGCIEEAERCLNTEAGLSASMLHGWRRIEQEARAAAAPRP